MAHVSSLLLLQEAALLPVDGGLLYRAVRRVLVELAIAKDHRDAPLQLRATAAGLGHALPACVQGGEGSKVDMGQSSAQSRLWVQHRFVYEQPMMNF